MTPMAHKEARHVEIVAGLVHEDPAAVLEVRYRRRCGISADDADSADVADRSRVDLKRNPKQNKCGARYGQQTFEQLAIRNVHALSGTGTARATARLGAVLILYRFVPFFLNSPHRVDP